MSKWQKSNYAVAAFISADICYVVILAGETHKSALQLLISSSGPFAMLPVFLYWHTTLWYTVCSCQPWGQLMNLALNQRTVISLLWLDGQVLQDVYLSRFHWWTVAEWTGIRCQYSTFLLGHNKTESQPFEKDNITDITLGGGGETRAGN